MTTTMAKLLIAPAALAALLVAGCDGEAPASTADYRAAAHIDLDRTMSAPWVRKAMGSDTLDLGGELGPCSDVLEAADSITLGSADDDFEIYVAGKIDVDQANACADFFDEHAKKSGGDEPEAVMVDAQLFAVFRGRAPSRANFEALLAADPSPSNSPMWVVAAPQRKNSKTPVSAVRGWASAAKGFDAHVDVQLGDETTATELYGKAMLGLAALQMSGEADELTKGLAVKNNGDTLTADLKLSGKDLDAIIGKGAAKVRARVEADDSKKDKSAERKHGSVSISFGSK